MTDRLHTMSMLVTVVDEGSISAGARALGMPVATVSRRISDLEKQLHAQLLTRSRSGLALTDTGTAYLSACRRILEQVNEAEQIAAGEFDTPRGTLHLTAPIVFGQIHVLPVVIAFLRTYPEVNIRFIQTDHPLHFFEDRIDLAVRIGHLSDSSLRARKIGNLRSVVCASPGYLQRHGTPRQPGDLDNHNCINFDRRTAINSWRFRSNGADHTVAICPSLQVNTADAATSAAREGLGLTQLLAYQVSKSVKDGTLVPVLTEFEREPVPVHLVYESQALEPQKLRAFLDFAAPRLQRSMAEAAF
ncbi:LysR substrate-binding domain-containing protein [Roseibium sp.]|uniref:LysR substrate-binding domain-containing protein n=1 Tax=Roseibium sp. TaxID=1936156 RepID=UPI003A9783D6